MGVWQAVNMYKIWESIRWIGIHGLFNNDRSIRYDDVIDSRISFGAFRFGRRKRFTKSHGLVGVQVHGVLRWRIWLTAVAITLLTCRAWLFTSRVPILMIDLTRPQTWECNNGAAV
jgi:hypothetical protein